jgi:hypothetical protein
VQDPRRYARPKVAHRDYATVSIPAIILLAVAVFTVHLPYGFSSIKLLSVSNGKAQFGPPGYECDLLYIASIVALALMGPLVNRQLSTPCAFVLSARPKPESYEL